MKHAQKILNPIFHTIYGQVESLSLYSKIKVSENERALKLFSGEDRRAIILYTIDKVNEGLHSKNFNTVILLRDTISPIVFYQQIGRAFSIKVANRPLIIDLVNNFKNIQLSSFKSDFEQEENVSVARERTTRGGKKKAAIKFVDEIQDIMQIFSSFEQQIDAWKGFYEKAKVYFKEHGHLYVPPGNRELYDWVRYQRKSYTRGGMREKRESLLRAIGIDFDNKIPAGWMMRLLDLEKSVKENGKIPPHTSSGYTWITRQKVAYKRGALIKEQIDLLRKYITLDNGRRSLTTRINSLKAHFRKGTIDTADERVKSDLAQVVFLYKSKKLRKAVLTDLRKDGVPIELSVQERVWIKKLKKLTKWLEHKGRLPKNNEDNRLHLFWSRERKLLKRIHPHAILIKTDNEAGKLYEQVKKEISRLKDRR